MHNLALDCNRLSQLAILNPFDGRSRLCWPHFVVVESFDIPGIPTAWAVFECLELIGNRIWREDFAIRLFVEDAGDVTLEVEFDAEKIVFEEDVGRWTMDDGRWFLVVDCLQSGYAIWC